MKLSKVVIAASLMIGGFQAAASTNVSNCQAKKDSTLSRQSQAKDLKTVDTALGTNRVQPNNQRHEQTASKTAGA